MQHLHMQARQANPFMAHQGWSVIAAACAVSLQLLTLLITRMLVTTCLSLAAVVVVYHILQGLGAAALLAKVPILQGLAALLTVRVAVRQWLSWLIHTGTAAVKLVHLMLLSGAHLVWELQELVCDTVWKLLQRLGLELQGDMGQAADALRNLADELEQLGVNPGGWFGGAGARRGGARRQLQALGSHWPSPLEVPFDVEELQSELGVEVPRGFVCPITQDIMQLPALLISSTVSVPATYDREAIVRWLEDSR
eukprot:gene6835-7053_t